MRDIGHITNADVVKHREGLRVRLNLLNEILRDIKVYRGDMTSVEIASLLSELSNQISDEKIL